MQIGNIGFSIQWLKNMAKMAKYHYLEKYVVFLPLFEKYLTIYHLFGTWVCETWVWNGTRVLKIRVP